ncbi:MAG: TetR family transcriptional regulator [Proteobacteria bacterium]|nr:TetR family transcriptional regulator [Pseudomonadota bacterium]MBI3497644.1 TetR family transcriptional regulator [Pseudomonadota bacterium]
MARRTGKTRARKPQQTGPEATGIEPRIVDAALALAAERRWREVALADIAQRAGVTLVDVYRHCPSKAAALAAFSRRIDAAVLAGAAGEDADEAGPRDRLFDVIMRRLDALAPYKQGVASIMADLPADPISALAQQRPFLRSMAWMLEAAGLSGAGLAGALRVRGLALVYLSTLRVWLADDGADLARTMAALDRSLKRAEATIKLLPRAWR